MSTDQIVGIILLGLIGIFFVLSWAYAFIQAKRMSKFIKKKGLSEEYATQRIIERELEV